MKSIPPLNALRAFEAAARHLSFSRAAQELHVTPGAISQQIRQLEDFLELRLFERRNRQILLTEAGQLCLPDLSKAFSMIEDSMARVRQQHEDGPLTITAPPIFVARWLIPRLNQFNRAFPEINVRIDASVRVVDLEHENIDVAIRFSQEQDPGLVSTHLFSLEMIPVCSPALLQQHPEISNPAGLSAARLLHYEDNGAQQTWPDWNMWLAAMELEQIDSSRGIVFNQPDLLMAAAVEGQGIALVATLYANKDIREGRLVQPFQLSLPTRFAYHLVTTRHKVGLRRVRAFSEWIVEQTIRA